VSRHHRPTRQERFDRRAARVKILTEANRHRVDAVVKPYTMCRIQDAVCAVRRRALVKDAVLVRAGFNPRTAPPKVASSPERPSPPQGRPGRRGAAKAAAA
jgi:hypothetical protein